MKAARKELAEAVLVLIENTHASEEVAEKVAAYLIAERRTTELNSLLRDLEELRFNKHDALEVTVEVAHPLNAEAKTLIQQLLGAKKVQIHEEINKDTLGGVRVRALDKVADFSVRARLQRLRQGGRI